MNTEKTPTGWRIKLGFTLFLFSLIGFPLIILALPIVGVPGATIAKITGALIVASELMMILGVAVAGKDGFAYIKKTVFGVFKKYGPPQQVSKTRYIIGLIFFTLPILSAILVFYIESYIPFFEEYKLTYAIVGDAMLLISLFILGGDFWDKLRSLFLYNVKVESKQ